MHTDIDMDTYMKQGKIRSSICQHTPLQFKETLFIQQQAVLFGNKRDKLMEHIQ